LDCGVSPKVWPISGVINAVLDGYEYGTRFI